MKKLKLKRKRWLDRHSKQLFYPQNSYARRSAHKKHESKFKFDKHNKLLYQPPKAKKKFEHNLSKGRQREFRAPENFSFFSNPNETLEYISSIQKAVLDGYPVKIVMEPIKKLSIDAIMYFLAILKRLKLSGVNYSFVGSMPDEQDSNQLLRISGFLDYVHTRSRRADLNRESDVVKIISGKTANPKTAKKMCDFVISKLGLKRPNTFRLYKILMELMANTKQHAYFLNRYETIHEWYIFVYYINDRNTVRFIFLDTGSGIPSTIRKKGWESAKAAFGIGSHTDYIKSALEGDYRSRTGELFRGNGLPTINSFCQEGYIKDLTIISNKGYCADHRQKDMSLDLNGTLFYWEMSHGIAFKQN